MKQSVLLLVGLYAYSLCAQPTISTDIIPAFGDSLHYVWANETDPLDNLTGANQTWDFSSLEANANNPDYYFKFIDPANTPHIDRYPNAELAAMTPGGEFVYYVLTNGTLELMGGVAEVPVFGTAFSDYDNHETEVVFPIQYGDSHTDIFDGNNEAGGFSAAFAGTWSAEVDGYGTLILPSGTFENVLRIKEERTYNITGAPSEMSTLWRYASAEHSLWLLSIEEFSNGGDAQVFYADSPNIINSVNENRLPGFSIFPNPVKAGQSINIKNIDEEIDAAFLVGFSGNLISRNIIKYNRLHVPTDLLPGVYFLKIISKDGRFFSEKIIVQGNN